MRYVPPDLNSIGNLGKEIAMKRLAVVGITLGLIATNAIAATVEFRGGMCIVSTSSLCAADGWNIGDCLLLRYSPPNLGTNGPTTEFSLLGQSSADNYSLASGSLVGTTLKAVAGKHVGRAGSSFNSTMRITSQSPVPTATSRFVNLQGNITNFNDTTGCTVGFRASATRRP